MTLSERKKQAKILRITRKIHRRTGVVLFVCFIFISITGILLGWKKHSGGVLLSETYQGESTDLSEWLPLDSLKNLANSYLLDSVSGGLSTAIDRIDVRESRGTVKFTYREHYWGLQIDGASGKLLNIERRRSDMIEQIHDASILDKYLGTSSEQIKLIYTSVTGLALLLFAVSGFWLWWGPKRMRRKIEQAK